MHRSLALLLAILLTSFSITSVGFAAQGGELRFELSQRSAHRVQLSLLDDEGSGHGRSSSSFALADLAGLDRSAMASSEATPISFALVREAGRIDCSGSGERGTAKGFCRFMPDRAFADYLSGQGLARPSEREAFALVMVGASRRLVQAIAAARYPTPDLDDLTALTALGVTEDYIAQLAASSYRPTDISDLIAFKALGGTPADVRAIRGSKVNLISADELIRLRIAGLLP